MNPVIRARTACACADTFDDATAAWTLDPPWPASCADRGAASEQAIAATSNGPNKFPDFVFMISPAFRIDKIAACGPRT
jgi:hypothetical protein